MVNTQVRQTTCLLTSKWKLFLTRIGVNLCTQTAGDSSFLDFKKTNWRHCIAELTFIFGECNIASDNIWTFPSVPVLDTYIGEKKQQHGLPVHRFYDAAFAPKRWNGAETALGLRRFLPNANCGENNLSRGQNGRVSRVSGNKTFFFLALKVKWQRFIFLLLYFSFKGIVSRIIMQKTACKKFHLVPEI